MTAETDYRAETMFKLELSDMNNSEEQVQEELTVFREFAKICPLRLLPKTAEKKRGKREPDILCDLESGEKLAFELVSCEDVTKDDSHPDGLAPIIPKRLNDEREFNNALREAWCEAVAAGHIEHPERFAFHSVDVYLRDGFPSKNRRATVAQGVIDLLNERGPGHHSVKDGVIRLVRCEQDPEHLRTEGPPSFHVPSGCGARPYVVEPIEEKLKKKYESNHKIHLLAWSTTACHAESVLWRDRLVDLLKSNGMGSFDRIWVFGYGEKSIVFDSAESLA